MDTFENASPPQEQPDMIQAACWECGRNKMCYEYIICCTGTHFHACPECREILQQAAALPRASK